VSALIPDQARRAWADLSAVLLAVGPAPCESSPVPEAWWSDGRLQETARAGCRGCPARAECLDYALTADERWGVWGATTPQERTA